MQPKSPRRAGVSRLTKREKWIITDSRITSAVCVLVAFALLWFGHIFSALASFGAGLCYGKFAIWICRSRGAIDRHPLPLISALAQWFRSHR